MEQPKIQPDKITKPIQLLAVWFAGLVLLVGLLLTGAKMIKEPQWLVPVLAISAIVIIPIFLYFVFLLQTKYRPQMQEDTFYSKYLDSSTNQIISFDEESKVNSTIVELKNQMIDLTESNKDYLKNIEKLIVNTSKQDSTKLLEIKKYIEDSTNSFNKVESTIKKSQFLIALNTLLPRFLEYKSALDKNGFHHIEIFTGGGKKELEKSLMSVGISVEPKFVYEIVNVLYPLGLEYVSLINDGMEIDLRQFEVVVGSHAFRSGSRKILKIDETLIKTLEKVDSIRLFHAMF